MKYAFIINPASGKGKHKDLEDKINELIESSSKDIKIYYTCGEKDATVLADAIAKEAGEEQVVIFACGGDGTIHEVANGIVGNDNAVLGVIPAGSGNDFVRTLGGLTKEEDGTEWFMDLYRQFNGEIMKSDLIKMTYLENDEMVSQYVVNGVNIGFDGDTAIKAHELKAIPGVGGSMSYILSAVVNLIKKKSIGLRVTVDGEEFCAEPMLLATVSNGRFCGGGFESCPHADLFDGLMEVFAAYNISRMTLLQFISAYRDGKIFEIPNLHEIGKYAQAKEVLIEPMNTDKIRFVGDGEIYCTEAVKLEVAKQAIWVNIPAEI